MGSSVCDTVYYVCVSNVGKILYAYNSNSVGDIDIENLATLCLEKAPSHHKWYFQTMFKKTFGFLMESDGFVYFAIFDENFGNGKKLEVLGHVRDEFKKVVAKKGLKRILANPNSVALQEQMLPIVRRLIASFEPVVGSGFNDGLSPSPVNDSNGQSDTSGSTKAPLLGKSIKQEKRKTRDHVISVRENGVVEDHRKSADKGGSKVDSSSVDPDNQGGGSVVGVSLTKEVSSMTRSSNQTVRTKWCRQVRIVLAIDIVICLILFIVWIVVCRGTECLR
uniref:phytolongin Phyl1.1 n=1 Tax=Erigeron canadensis TaxID=72917 RepID=UPI001CB93F52|nr:phytolongin Phyl1.1 [Erigeron canadensis]